MNKDAILASIIGFGIGLLITGGVIIGPRLLTQLKNNKGDVASATTEKKTEASPTPESSKSNQELTIDSPTKETILHDSTTEVSGKAPSQAVIVIGTTEDETVVETKDTTSYKATVTLKEGKNDISVASILNGKETVERVTVYYTSEK